MICESPHGRAVAPVDMSAHGFDRLCGAGLGRAASTCPMVHTACWACARDSCLPEPTVRARTRAGGADVTSSEDVQAAEPESRKRAVL